MFAQPAFLLALVTEQLRHSEPLDRLAIIPFVRGHQARQRGSHFWPKRHSALAFIDEIVKLADDFLAALRGEQFQRFERRPIIFAKAVTTRRRPPAVKDILAGV